MAKSGKNLKDVIRCNGTWFLNVFKKDIVGYSNHLWQAEIITEAVKNGILSSNVGVAQQASDLLSNVSTAFATASDMQKQTEYMKELLRFLESEGETEMVKSMRGDLRNSFGIEIPSSYGNPSSDQARQSRYPQSEPVDMMYYSNEEFTYQEGVFDMDSSVTEPTKTFVVMPPVGKSSPYVQRRNMVFPSDQSNPHHYAGPQSDPAPYSRRRNNAIYSSGKGRRTIPRSQPFSGSGSPMLIPVLETNDDGGQHNQFSGERQTSFTKEEQNNSVFAWKHEEQVSLRELKTKLEERDKEFAALHQEHHQLQRQLERDNQEKMMRKLELQQQLEKENHEKLMQKLSEIELKLSKGNEKVYSKIDEELNVFKDTMLARQRSNEGSILTKIKSFQEIMLSKLKAQDSRFNTRFKTEQVVCSVCFVVLITLFAIILKLLWK